MSDETIRRESGGTVEVELKTADGRVVIYQVRRQSRPHPLAVTGPSPMPQPQPAN